MKSRSDLSGVVDRAGDTGDVTAYLVILAAVGEFLPAIATILSIFWLAIRIWDSRPVREWTGRDRAPRGDE